MDLGIQQLLIQILLQRLNLNPGVQVEPEQTGQRQQQRHTESDSTPRCPVFMVALFPAGETLRLAVDIDVEDSLDRDHVAVGLPEGVAVAVVEQDVVDELATPNWATRTLLLTQV